MARDILREPAQEPDERDFDFSQLWQDEVQGNFGTIFHIVEIVAIVILMIIVLVKK